MYYRDYSVDKYEKGGMMAKGGKMTEEEGVDLFENDGKDMPKNVYKILNKYDYAFIDGDWEGLGKAKNELKKIGYTFDFYLDGQAYDLRKIGQKGKVGNYSDRVNITLSNHNKTLSKANKGGMMAKGGEAKMMGNKPKNMAKDC